MCMCVRVCSYVCVSSCVCVCLRVFVGECVILRACVCAFRERVCVRSFVRVCV